ncbi:hypothetical protein HanXRQr2_Chr09g0373461 [Helianthus annuus]|uniref:Uncharacterized protein n=1 Tax=Helianthus annuus TaxID=4232 RepID=A0A9K3I3M6_HELAN|nr:hypothetical protein HanXRQr2_Chr09g0373461 [Helianthus annuus]KAJ0891937.1 hypothetical protein HanPSC8_Chr09g0359931 [Helianthus annuus]
MLFEFFDLKSCSVSGVMFKLACKTTGDNALHTDVFPASCPKTEKTSIPQSSAICAVGKN